METGVPFGLWLAKRCNALDLTRAGFARELGSSISALRKIEVEERRLYKGWVR